MPSLIIMVRALKAAVSPKPFEEAEMERVRGRLGFIKAL